MHAKGAFVADGMVRDKQEAGYSAYSIDIGQVELMRRLWRATRPLIITPC
jgi:hypothetical protein